MSSQEHRSGRLTKAPENFIDPEGVRTVFREAKAGRRDFVRGAFAAALAGVAAPVALAQANPAPAAGATRTSSNCPSTAKAWASRSSPTAMASPRNSRPTCNVAPAPA